MQNGPGDYFFALAILDVKRDIRRRAWIYTFSKIQGTGPDAMQLARPGTSYSDTRRAAAVRFLPKI